MTKYLQIRHWDYWWGVYGYLDALVSGVEFSITEDRDGEQLFFHMDLYTLPALEEFLKSEEYIEKTDRSFPCFVEMSSALHRGSMEYFIGGLYYRDYWPEIAWCNQFWQEEKRIFSLKSPEREPYYAVVFIREERPLLPKLLLEWVKKMSVPLFRISDDYEIANQPSYEAAGAEYQLELERMK